MSRKVYTMKEVDYANFWKGRLGGVPGQDFMRKEDLVDGEYYFGKCRNAKCARWDVATQEFTYMRTKFGDVFPETIKHPEDDNGFDLFLPLYRCYPTEAELCPGDEKEGVAVLKAYSSAIAVDEYLNENDKKEES